jgi:WD40 repeat protein
MIATSCEDKKIRVFYLSSTANPLRVFSGHTAKVFSVKWSPLVEGISRILFSFILFLNVLFSGMFCSSSDDMKVLVWY